MYSQATEQKMSDTFSTQKIQLLQISVIQDTIFPNTAIEMHTSKCTLEIFSLEQLFETFIWVSHQLMSQLKVFPLWCKYNAFFCFG